MFTDGGGQPIHPHAISQAFERIARRAGVPVIRLHELRHTHGTLFIAAGVPVKVVSERLGHATPAFTIETYQHVLPGMQADAARVFERLPAAVTLDDVREPVLDVLVGRVAATALEALAPAADELPFPADARVDDAVFGVAAERAFHRTAPP